MNNNDYTEDTQDNSVEEAVEESSYGEEESAEDQPNVEELQAELAKYKRMAQQKAKKAEKATSPSTPSEEVAELRAELAKTQLIAKGYDGEELEVISRVSKDLGISLLEAANKKYVQAEINELREENKVKAATPSPSGKSGKDSRNVDYYIKNDVVPEDPEMIREFIARKAGKTYKPLPK